MDEENEVIPRDAALPLLEVDDLLPPAPPRLEREGRYVGTDPNDNIVTLVPGRYIVRSPRGEQIDWAGTGSDKALMIVSSVR